VGNVEIAGLLNASHLTVSNEHVVHVSAQIESVLSISEDNAAVYMNVAIGSSIVLLIYLIVLCLTCKQVQRTIELIKHAAAALGNSSGLVLLPLFISAVQLAAIVLCAVLLLCVVTDDGEGAKSYAGFPSAVGDVIKDQEAAGHVSPELAPLIDEPLAQLNSTWPLVWTLNTLETKAALSSYVLFTLLWTYTFLSAVGIITIAANVFYFYFVDKDTVRAEAYLSQYDDNQTNWPVLTHLCYTIRFHLGTAAFGSLVLSVAIAVQLVCAQLVRLIEAKDPNPLLKVVAYCLQCFLCCFRKSIEFINSYAFVYVFIENVGFCTGCSRAFSLITAYPAQIAINTTVQVVLTFLQSITTPLACVIVANVALEYFPIESAVSTDATSELVVLLAVFVLSLTMTRAFAHVYEQVVTSLTICVLVDMNQYQGRFMDDQLREAFDFKKEESRKRVPTG